LVMALISLVPVLIVLCVALMLTYRTMEEQLVYDSKMSVEWLQERLEMEIEDYTRTFYEFEIDKDFRSALSQWCLQGDELNYSSKLELITGLNQTVSINRNINAIELYNLSRDKALIAERSSTFFTDTAGRLEQWLSRDEALQSNLVFLRSGREILLMHQMHRFENGEPYALLVLRLRAYFVQDILDAIKSTPQESIILFNDQGEVIESDMSEYAGFGAEEALGYAERLSGTISGHTHENGCYWFYRSVSGGKLNIVQAMPDSAIRSSLEGTLVSGIFVAILAVAASMLFSAIVSRVISRPIVELANTMRSSTFEDNVLVRSQRSDEIGFLLDSFNLMQKQNKELVDSEYTSQIARRSAQLQALQSQINPHFLYNTLQVIGGLALRKNAPEIYSVTTALGDILRYSLNFTDETVSLAEELHYFESYLSIQKQRFGDKLHISIAVPGEIAAAPVPKLILQPILENSFQHGLPDKKACWDISIEAVRRDGRLEITVSDNGVGIPQEKLAELRETLRTANYGGLRSGRHIGLANVNMRIRLRDGGDPFGVDIQSVEGEGTVVTLVLRDRLGEEGNNELHRSDN
uniref:sensor histidine kinase n=2 Tax=Oscillospiraceae TaxID=216572 RepID=UPI00331F7C49